MYNDRDLIISLAFENARIYIENNLYAVIANKTSEIKEFSLGANTDPGDISMQYSYAVSHLLGTYGLLGDERERVIAENFSNIAMFGSVLYSKVNSGLNLSSINDLDMINQQTQSLPLPNLLDHSIKTLKSRWTQYDSVNGFAENLGVEPQVVISKCDKLGINLNDQNALLDRTMRDQLEEAIIASREETRSPFL